MFEAQAEASINAAAARPAFLSLGLNLLDLALNAEPNLAIPPRSHAKVGRAGRGQLGRQLGPSPAAPAAPAAHGCRGPSRLPQRIWEEGVLSGAAYTALLSGKRIAVTRIVLHCPSSREGIAMTCCNLQSSFSLPHFATLYSPLHSTWLRAQRGRQQGTTFEAERRAWAHGALQALERAGEAQLAALLHQQLGRFTDARRLFLQTGDRQRAAECCEAAARAMLAAGKQVSAASWVAQAIKQYKGLQQYEKCLAMLELVDDSLAPVRERGDRRGWLPTAAVLCWAWGKASRVGNAATMPPPH